MAGKQGLGRETDFRIATSCDVTHQALEGQSRDEQFATFLKPLNLFQSQLPGSESLEHLLLLARLLALAFAALSESQSGIGLGLGSLVGMRKLLAGVRIGGRGHISCVGTGAVLLLHVHIMVCRFHGDSLFLAGLFNSH